MNLKKKVGPLPLWGWGAAVAVGILLYYLRSKSASAITTAATQPQAQLDPTQGSFSMPSGISSGGTSPVTTSPPDFLTELNDVSAVKQVFDSWTPAPGQPQDPSTGYDPVGDTVRTIQELVASGLIAPLPSSTGAATSTAQTHTKPAPVSTRVNSLGVNQKTGKVFRVVSNPQGKPKGVYHVYTAGTKKKFVKVHK